MYHVGLPRLYQTDLRSIQAGKQSNAEGAVCSFDIDRCRTWHRYVTSIQRRLQQIQKYKYAHCVCTLCDRLIGRVTGIVRPSVCLSCLSVCPAPSPNSKTKAREEKQVQIMIEVIRREAKSLIGAAPWWIISRQVQFLAGGSTPKSPLSLGSQGPNLTQCVETRKCTCQRSCKSVERFKQNARPWQTTDRRQTALRKMGSYRLVLFVVQFIIQIIFNFILQSCSVKFWRLVIRSTKTDVTLRSVVYKMFFLGLKICISSSLYTKT